jgi:hypothetical protein
VATPRHQIPTVDQPAHAHSVVRYQLTVLEILRRYRQPENWWAQAACRGQGCESWFPELHQRPPSEAREACARCPVVEQCRQAGEQALDGMWGGRLVRRNRHALPGIATRGPLPPQTALVG